MPIISSKVDLWDAIAIWSLIALAVFEVLHALTKRESGQTSPWCCTRENLINRRWQRFSDWCERLGYLSLAFLALSDYQAHKYRLIQNGLFAKNQEAFQKLVSDQSKSISSLQDQLIAANAVVLETSRNTATLRKSTESFGKDIEQLGQKSEVAILALRAEDDDALAFDRLRQFAALPATDPRRGPAESAVNRIILARNSHDWKLELFQSDMPEQQGIDMFYSSGRFTDSRTRRDICDTLSQYPSPDVARKSVFRRLMLIAGSDPSLNVREAAYRAYASIMFAWWLSGNSKTFNSMTPEQQKSMRMVGIRVLDIEKLKDDWAGKEPRNMFPE